MQMIDYLNSLEQAGQYVFHGSPFADIEILVPKQGKHFPNPDNPEEFILDGAPAISATPYVDFAIFRALINKENISFPFRSGFGFDQNKQKEFRVSKSEVIEELKNKKGYVYIFDKKDFEPYSRSGQAHEGNMEWRAYTEVKPVEIVEVQYGDLKNIESVIQFTDSERMV
ncbi:MAG: hypothetical protein ACK4FA_02150 [Candidatus Paceibacteria bacterium]